MTSRGVKHQTKGSLQPSGSRSEPMWGRGPRCIVSQLIRVYGEEDTWQVAERRGEGTAARLETTGRVFLETRVNIPGLYSVEMEERMHVERVSKHHGVGGMGGSLATALKTDNHTKS